MLSSQDISFVCNYRTLSSFGPTRTAAFVLISIFLIPCFPLSFLSSILTLPHNYSFVPLVFLNTGPRNIVKYR